MADDNKNPEEAEETTAADETATEETVDAAVDPAAEPDVADETAPAEEVAATKIVPGMVLRVHQKVKEGDRERIQVFQGLVIARKGQGAKTATVTVRKVSGGIGVERIFPVNSPNIARMEVVKRHRIRRAKLYYARTHKKRLKDAAV